MDVFRQRLEDEYDASVIITSPSVPYEVLYRGGKTKLISNPVEFPDPHDGKVLEVREPMVKATIIAPDGQSRDYVVPGWPRQKADETEALFA